MYTLFGKEGTPAGGKGMVVGTTINDQIAEVKVFCQVSQHSLHVGTTGKEHQQCTG